ncbi:hypothetical protein EBR25_09795 [bacterium]|jgi:hypothetical protein|nr:hypothetical protein [bacterium]
MSTWSHPLEFGYDTSAATSLHFSEGFDEEAGTARGPERTLMSAILFDGIQAYMNFICADTDRDQKKYEEAVRWVSREDHEYIFSFNNVCEGLGINAEYLRTGLTNAASSQSFEWKRVRRST